MTIVNRNRTHLQSLSNKDLAACGRSLDDVSGGFPEDVDCIKCKKTEAYALWESEAEIQENWAHDLQEASEG